jgi:hypothetical protein
MRFAVTVSLRRLSTEERHIQRIDWLAYFPYIMLCTEVLVTKFFLRKVFVPGIYLGKGRGPIEIL